MVETPGMKRILMIGKKRLPDFNNLARVLEKQKPSRPTLFEFMIDDGLLQRIAGRDYGTDYETMLRVKITAFERLGYDFTVAHASLFHFRTAQDKHGAQTVSMNQGFLITDRESFDRYEWNEPEDFPLSPLEAATADLPEGMKLIICGPCGVLENAVAIVGYENLCLMAYEDPALLEDIFDCIGSRLLRYYESVASWDSVGAIMSNDDWGFNTQTMLSPEMMRHYVFPWHKRIAEAAHRRGKYALLHSCGCYRQVIGDIIDDMRFDGRHSYQDNIVPVEEAYESLKGRIAVLGGIDMDYLARSSPEEIRGRCRAMLERSAQAGGYALGSGNSIPAYIPYENYRTLLDTVLEEGCVNM